MPRRPTLSLRLKLVLLAFALVAVAGGSFGIMASRDASRALEVTVERQLQMVAADVARNLAAALATQQGKVRSWAHQGVMRDIIVGDVDKRIAAFLHAEQAGDAGYLDVFVLDADGKTVASSDPHLITVSPPAGSWRDAVARHDIVLVGPRADGARRILEIAAPIADPEHPNAAMGALLAWYDWSRLVTDAAETVRDLAAAGFAIEVRVIDASGRVIGGAGADGQAIAIDDVYAPTAETLIGRARLGTDTPAWTVLASQSRAAALFPVRRMRQRLALALLVILTAGVTAATIVARRMTRPLHSLTVAARDLARGTALHPLAVRSHDEIGELTTAFNAMTTDLRQAQHDLVAAAKLASVGEIAAGLAHEIRTPLGIMRGSAQMLGRARGSDPARTGELVDIIVGEVDRLERVVAALTELGRPHEPVIDETLLAPVLARAIEFVAGQAASQGVTIDQRFERPCLALCDPEQLYQVALNFLVNALHVLPTGGQITVETFGPEQGHAGFEITDDGPGIAPEIQKEIFTPFFTRREGGTGLGLAFVERVVVAHQGRVSVRSTPGSGTTFRVELPAAEGKA